jgi:hypothetical protein
VSPTNGLTVTNLPASVVPSVAPSATTVLPSYTTVPVRLAILQYQCSPVYSLDQVTQASDIQCLLECEYLPLSQPLSPTTETSRHLSVHLNFDFLSLSEPLSPTTETSRHLSVHLNFDFLSLSQPLSPTTETSRHLSVHLNFDFLSLS